MASLNKKRLTRKEVKALIEAEGELEAELTAALREVRESWINEPKIYRLPENRYLYVFDENDISLPGKGDIYSAEDMRQHVEWTEDVRTSSRGNSVEDWRYHSKLKDELIGDVEKLIAELSEVSGLDLASLDRSYKSLNLVSQYLSGMGYKRARSELFDHLVVYVGEVLLKRSGGKWHTAVTSSGQFDYPYILGPKGGVMMPINAVWHALDAYGKCQLRQPTVNEYRQYCIR